VTFTDRFNGTVVETISLDVSDASNLYHLMPSRHNGCLKVAAPRSNDRGCTSIHLLNIQVAANAGPHKSRSAGIIDVQRTTAVFPKAGVISIAAIGSSHVFRVLLINESGSRCIESVTADFRASMIERTAPTLLQRITWSKADDLPNLRSACEQQLEHLFRSLPPRTAQRSHEVLSSISELQSVALALFHRETELVQDAISSEDSISVLLNRKLRTAYLVTVTAMLLQRVGVFERCETESLSDFFQMKRDTTEQSAQLGDFFRKTFHLDARFSDSVLEISRWSGTPSLAAVILAQMPSACAVVDPAGITLLGLLELSLRASQEIPDALAVLIGCAAWSSDAPEIVAAAVDGWLEAVQLRRCIGQWSAAVVVASRGDSRRAPPLEPNVDSLLASLEANLAVGNALVPALVDVFCAANRFEQAFALVPLALARDSISDRLAVKLLLLCFLRRHTSLLVQLFLRSGGSTWRAVATTVLVHAAVDQMSTCSESSSEALGGMLLQGLIQPNSVDENTVRAALLSIGDDRSDRLRIEFMITMHHYDEALQLCREFRVRSAEDGMCISDLQRRLECLVESPPSERTVDEASLLIAPLSGTTHVSVLNSKMIRNTQLIVVAEERGIAEHLHSSAASAADGLATARPSQNISILGIAQYASTPRPKQK
jgi:hypothetical protein